MRMERSYGRHRRRGPSISGVYGSAYEGDDAGFAAIQPDIDAFAEPRRAAGRACWW
jgi:methylmalonyl-CoA mutase